LYNTLHGLYFCIIADQPTDATECSAAVSSQLNFPCYAQPYNVQ